jgi:hypothetical protein
MMMQKLQVKPGMHAWVDYPCASHALAGVRDDAFVLILSMSDRECTVRTEDGAKFTLPHYCLCAGYSFEGRTGWVPESDPRVLDWLEKRLVALNSTPWQDGVESVRMEVIANTEKILERNGRSPAAAA